MSASQANGGDRVATVPQLNLLVREKTRAYITPFPYTVGTECKESLPEAKDAAFSPAGDFLASIEGEDQALRVRNSDNGKVISTFGGLKDVDTPLKVAFFAFSPKGTYVLAWSRPVTNISVPNLVIYRTASGERLAAFHQKTFHIDYWPSVQWSDDESVAIRAVTNTIHLFPGDALHKAPTSKLGIPGVSKFALSYGEAPYTIAAFISGKSGGPGEFAIYRHPDQGGDKIAGKTTFKADSVTFKWNSKGSALLALASTNVDTTGKSYYGESGVYFVHSNGSANKRVDLPQEGPTYDCAWSPSGQEFIVIYGFMPARATMFNIKCEPIFDFGTGSRNTISFSPYGRYVALAGFGNLAGKVEFWDKNKDKDALVGRAELPCTTAYSWSPCSRYFLGATTFPRLRVDNGFSVVRFDGQKIHEHKLGETLLYQAVFRPAARGVHQDPKITAASMIGGPPVPPKEQKAKEGDGTAHKKTGVYRPPGSRGSAASFSLHQHVEAGKVDKNGFLSTGRGVTFAPGTSSGKKTVPGMDPSEVADAAPSKAALKRKKKKEKERQAQLEKEAAAKGSSQPAVPVGNIDSAVVAEKRIKSLNKKLRQIESLRSSAMEGKELNEDQEAKIANEDTVKAELAEAENKLKSLKMN